MTHRLLDKAAASLHLITAIQIPIMHKLQLFQDGRRNGETEGLNRELLLNIRRSAVGTDCIFSLDITGDPVSAGINRKNGRGQMFQQLYTLT
jgi:hypothetical protein